MEKITATSRWNAEGEAEAEASCVILLLWLEHSSLQTGSLQQPGGPAVRLSLWIQAACLAPSCLPALPLPLPSASSWDPRGCVGPTQVAYENLPFFRFLMFITLRSPLPGRQCVPKTRGLGSGCPERNSDPGRMA